MLLSTVFAMALAGEAPAPLELNLSCPGGYRVVESSRASVSGKIGEESKTATVQTPVMNPGTTHVSLRGDAGEILFPDGERRLLTNIVADERRIRADYAFRILLIKVTNRVDINRLTGDIRVTSGDEVLFAGACETAPTKPKF